MLRVPVAGLLVSLVVLAGLANASDGCYDVEGTFENFAVAPPECQSPVLFCTLGLLSGDLEGDYFFTMTSQTPDLDEPPVTMDFEGESTIELEGGVMVALDHGSITFQVLAPSPFQTFVEIHDGSGAYAGFTGSLVATGEYDLVLGEGEGSYTGQLCLP